MSTTTFQTSVQHYMYPYLKKHLEFILLISIITLVRIVRQLSRILHPAKGPPSGKGSREMYESTQISREHQMRVSIEPDFR